MLTNKWSGKLKNLKLVLVVFMLMGVVSTSYFVLNKLNKPKSFAMASTFTVNVTSDAADANAGDGVCATAGSVCTLRAAIEETNALSGSDLISFNIPKTDTGCVDPDGGGAGACNNGSNDDTGDEYWTIQPASSLPGIDDTTGGTIVDGYTQTGASANTNETGALNTVLKIEVDGTNITSDGIFYIPCCGANTGHIIRGLAINRSTTAGIAFGASLAHHNKIQGCFIGTDITGLLDLGNTTAGIFMSSQSSCTIGTDGDNTNDVAERNLISGNNTHGVYVSYAPSTVVAGNIIGLDKTGVNDLGNTIDGVYVDSGASTRIGTDGNNISDNIERNVISGNNGKGVYLKGYLADNCRVAGNYVGTNVSGTASVKNNGDGIIYYGISGTVVGVDGDGSAGESNEGNLVSGNARGIVTYSSDSTIAGNIIGLNASGDAKIPNTGIGVYFAYGVTNTTVGTNGDGTSDVLERNIISGNSGVGLRLFSHTSSGYIISGNYIGTDLTGLLDLGNTGHGIFLEGSSTRNTSDYILGSNLDGTSDTNEGNVISGNGGSGIYAVNASSETKTGHKVSGNKIGVGSDGTTAIGNTSYGIYMDESCIDWVIGSTDYNVDGINIIANNGNDGIAIDTTSSATTGNRISYNSFYNNTGLAIDLKNDGTTVNDEGDTDSGPNKLLNFPVITTANQNAVSGTLDIDTNETTSKVELYLTTDGSGGYGEGKTYLGSIAPTENDTGAWSITGLSLSNGNYVTALTVDSSGNTSEFCLNRQIAELTYTISGKIFNDTNYSENLDGNGHSKDGIGYEDGTDSVMKTVTVELYNSENSLIDTDITDSSGNYSFYDISGGTYKVRAVSSTMHADNTSLESGRYIATDMLPEQTYENNGSSGNGGSGALGGNNPSIDDTATNVGAGPGDTNVTVTISGDNLTGVDLGFSFEVVTNTNNSGQGSLRQAIINTDKTGDNVVAFNLSKADTACIDPDGGGTGACDNSNNDSTGDEYWTFLPTTDLPSFKGTSGVTINGYTQSPASVNTSESGALNAKLAIDINGTNDASEGVFYVEANSNVVFKGMAVNKGQVYGIRYANNEFSNGKVQGCFVGTDVTGTVDYGNTSAGIYITHVDGVVVGVDGDGSGDAGERNIISGNNAEGIKLEYSANSTIIAGNIIGLDKTGLNDLGNTTKGIFVAGNGGSSNRIGTDGNNTSDIMERNIISGNNEVGVFLTGTSQVLAGNYIGTNITGTAAVPNISGGINLYPCTSCIIGVNGDASAGEVNEGNLISGNTSDGLIVASCSGTVVAGNIVGLTASGTSALANGGNGISLGYGTTNSIIGTNGDNVSDVLERNIISGNTNYGIRMYSHTSSGDKVSGSYIGTDITGLLDFGNGSHGIYVEINEGYNDQSYVIGSDLNSSEGDSNEGNIISGNTGSGIYFTSGTNNNHLNHKISGNKIGAGSDGTTVLGNDSYGIYIGDRSTGFVIGSTDNSLNGINIIANNGADGVALVGSNTSGNYIAYNSIYDNVGLGIDLNDDNVTVNDVADGDTGVNTLVNYPVLTSYTDIGGGEVTIQGTLDLDTSEASSIVLFYEADIDDSSYGEGKTYLGQVTGGATFTKTLTTFASNITATVIDTNNNTSEFSLVISSNIIPTQGELGFQSELRTNYVTEDLTATVTSVADMDADTPLVSSIFWTAGSISVMNLALPFDIVTQSLTDNIHGVRDFSGNSNHGQRGSGIVSAAPTSVIGIKGWAYSFDGGDQIEVSDSNSLDLIGSYTIETWVNANSYAGSLNTILEKQSDKYGLYINDSGKAVFKDHNGSLVGTTTLATDTWYQIVGVHTGSAKKIYVNGVEENTESATAGTAGTESLIIGGAAGETAFNGKIDEVYLYGIVLTGTQIIENYNEGTPHHTVIKSSMLSEGDNWEVSSVISDGKSYSAIENSDSLSISVESTGSNALISILNPYVIPNPPTLKGIKNITQNSITWEINSNILNESGYKLKDYETNDLKILVGENVHVFVEENLLSNTLYERYVTTYNRAGESRASEKFSEYTLASIPELELYSQNGKEVTVKIKGVDTFPYAHQEDKTAYKFYDENDNYDSGWLKDILYTFTDLKLDTIYNFRVKVRNGDGKEVLGINPVEFLIPSDQPLAYVKMTASEVDFAEGSMGINSLSTKIPQVSGSLSSLTFKGNLLSTTMIVLFMSLLVMSILFGYRTLQALPKRKYKNKLRSLSKNVYKLITSKRLLKNKNLFVYVRVLGMLVLLIGVIAVNQIMIGFKIKDENKKATYASMLTAAMQIEPETLLKYTIEYKNIGMVPIKNIRLGNLLPGFGYRPGSLQIDSRNVTEKWLKYTLDIDKLLTTDDIVLSDYEVNKLNFKETALEVGEGHTISYIYHFTNVDYGGEKINALTLSGYNLRMMKEYIIVKVSGGKSNMVVQEVPRINIVPVIEEEEILDILIEETVTETVEDISDDILILEIEEDIVDNNETEEETDILEIAETEDIEEVKELIVKEDFIKSEEEIEKEIVVEEILKEKFIVKEEVAVDNQMLIKKEEDILPVVKQELEITPRPSLVEKEEVITDLEKEKTKEIVISNNPIYTVTENKEVDEVKEEVLLNNPTKEEEIITVEIPEENNVFVEEFYQKAVESYVETKKAVTEVVDKIKTVVGMWYSYFF